MHGNMNVKYTRKASLLFLYIEQQRCLPNGLEDSGYDRVCAFFVYDCECVRNLDDLPKTEAAGRHLYIRREFKRNC